jgi:hypothetical protein
MRIHLQSGKTLHASKVSQIWLASAGVCELKGIVNVRQVHVFLHPLPEELALGVGLRRTKT